MSKITNRDPIKELACLNILMSGIVPTLPHVSLVVMGHKALCLTAPVSKIQCYKNISYVINMSLSSFDQSPEWTEVLKKLQMEAAKLLMDFGCPELAAANANKVLEREHDNIEANEIVATAMKMLQ